MKTIGIIGAGFSGTMMAYQLIKKTTEPIHIYLIDRNEVARGQAYADISPELLLNVRADQMGAIPEDVGHFYKWLKAHKVNAKPSDFISRKLYGDYLNEILFNAIENSNSLITIDIIKDLVLDINSDNKEILFQSRTPLKIDQLIIATGLESPTEFNFSHLKDSFEPVTIIGTGLSMVDVIIYLKSINHQGMVTAVSRRGFLPQSHKFFDSKKPKPVYNFSNDLSLKNTLKEVRRNLKLFEWRLVIDGLRPFSQLLWKNWSQKERGQFLRHLRSLWDNHRHRISPLHQKILDHLIQNGKIEIKATHFKPYKATTKIIIHCHGLSYLSNNLTLKLIEKGTLKADNFNLGIESEVDWVHLIGPLKRGQLWESIAVPEIRIQVQELSAFLLFANL